MIKKSCFSSFYFDTLTYLIKYLFCIPLFFDLKKKFPFVLLKAILNIMVTRLLP